MKHQTHKTILEVLSLYLLSSAIFLSVFFFTTYDLQEKNIFYEESQRLFDARGALLYLFRQKNIPRQNNAPFLEEFSEEFDVKLAIYNQQGLVFSNLKYYSPSDPDTLKEDTLLIDGRMYLIDRLKRSHKRSTALKGSLIILEGHDLSLKLFWFKIKFIGFIFITIALMGIIALLLVRIYTKPLKQQLAWFDRFLKDSTHEINTPLSVIMMSIERFNRQELSDKNNKKLDNIAIASRTLSHIYDDLVYLNFPDAIPAQKTTFDIKELLEERINFFALHISQKKLTLELTLTPCLFHANRYKFSKLIDNLLSNAIKYNHVQGYIHLKLDNHIFSITNSGESISTEHHQEVFKRYVRLNEDQGGFGIGLNIVESICKEYNITLTLNSNDHDTTITLQLPKES